MTTQKGRALHRASCAASLGGFLFRISLRSRAGAGLKVVALVDMSQINYGLWLTTSWL